jgi:hypothetical protein
LTTQTQFLRRARVRLNELTARQFQDQDLREWLNEAARDIARKTECLQERTAIAGVVGTAEYTLPATAIRVFRVEFTPTSERTRALEYVDVKNMDGFGWEQRDRTQSYPSVFTVWGSGSTLKLIAFPSPGTAGSFTIWYYRLPTDLAEETNEDGGEDLELPQGWDDIVLDYVEYRALRKDRDQRWTESKALYDENLSTMYDNTRRWVESSGVISPDHGSLPYWLTSFGG